MQESQFQGTENYLVTPELSNVVHVAMTLEKPLLIRGEPGTGKTVLAEALAGSLGLELISWHIKSTSKAQDGLYVYDTVQRLNDSRFGDGEVSDIERYIKFGPLGRALANDQKVVLLIDEIDKADIEFPNDLLHELDRMQFAVVETGRHVSANVRPVVIITSNNEKELPDAFLRRCIFHYIEFPDRDTMSQIIRMHYPQIEEKLLAEIMQRFYWLRDLPNLRKPPSTSELIDWVCALERGGVEIEQLAKSVPFLGVLLKRESDIEAADYALKNGY